MTFVHKLLARYCMYSTVPYRSMNTRYVHYIFIVNRSTTIQPILMTPVFNTTNISFNRNELCIVYFLSSGKKMPY